MVRSVDTNGQQAEINRDRPRLTELPSQAIPWEQLPDNEKTILEEYKLIVAERRFIMTRYMQSLIFYPVILGYAFVQLISARSKTSSVLFALLLVFVNTAFLYGAKHFRKMAYHALNRETILAHRLGVQYPHPMIWGYYAGLYGFIFTYFFIGAVLYIKLAHPEAMPNLPIQPPGNYIPQIIT